MKKIEFTIKTNIPINDVCDICHQHKDTLLPFKKVLSEHATIRVKLCMHCMSLPFTGLTYERAEDDW